jgi:dCMP deaminase
MIVAPMTEIDILRLAAREAVKNSSDPDTQNGAVLARRNDVVFMAANAFPDGVEARHHRLYRPEKYRFIEHAERNVIYRAAATGWGTGGAAMYCLWFSCPDCARAIIQAGIYEVVGHVAPRRATPARWLQAVSDGEAMLREAGVGMRWLADPLGVTIRFDGKEMVL